MTTSSPAVPGRIFISYRREDTAYAAGWLFDRLAGHFGQDQVFKDVDSIQLGEDFVDVIAAAVGSCDVLLSLIGDRWLTITDGEGRRRLDAPGDYVRLEIEAALTRDVLVIPILVEGARMPGAGELPASLAKLARRQALELSPSRFEYDTGRLLRVLDRTLAEMRPPSAVGPDVAAGPVPGEPGAGGRRRNGPAETRESAAPSSAPPARSPAQRGTGFQEPPAVPAGASVAPPPGIPSVGPAPPIGRTPPDAGKPSRRRRRIFARIGILAGAGAGAVLIAILAATLLASPRTTPSATIILKDNFASMVSGWKVVRNSAYGRYSNGTYQIRAAPRGDIEFAVPEKVRDLYRSAPSQISISVTARRIVGPAQDALYGIVCREADDTAYGFGVENNTVVIFKLLDGAYKPLIPVRAAAVVRVNGANRLRAVSTSAGARAAVHLTFWVNGQKLLDVTDKNDPLANGAVGLFAATNYSDSNTLSGAEFSNVVVTRV